MTDAEVLAKVRQAAEEVLSLFDGIDEKRATPCARAALAMVEQWEWHREEVAHWTPFHETAKHDETRVACDRRIRTHQESADRILSALRRAVGE